MVIRYILGISGGYFHDSSACIVKGGKIIAYSEEERFSRVKLNKDSRSCYRSIFSCLKQANIQADEISYLAINWNPYFPEKENEFIEDDILKKELIKVPDLLSSLPKKIHIINHHLAHAASSFYCSGFPSAAIIVVDGSGDGIATSIYSASLKGGIEKIKEYDFTQSLGWFYEAATEYIGFRDWTSSGKFMGLASYGNLTLDLSELINTHNNHYFIKYPFKTNVENYSNLKDYRKIKDHLYEKFKKLGVQPAQESYRLSAITGRWEMDANFEKAHKDFAASVQHSLNSCMSALVKDALKLTGNDNVCLAGGVALNCSANGNITKKFNNKKIFISPFSGDSGGSVGAAISLSEKFSSNFQPEPLREAGIAESYTSYEIEEVLKKSGLNYFKCSDFPRYVAEQISNGKIAAWFQGRAEAGQRALGHRSILADARYATNCDRVNSLVKSRELWRPLCPSIAKDYLSHFIINPVPDPFMVRAQDATDYAKKTIPAVVHVDGTMRAQCVDEKTNPDYHQLIMEIKDITGVPVVLNTSFNTRGEPIVGSPLDAIRTFVSTNIDVLSIGHFILEKNNCLLGNDNGV